MYLYTAFHYFRIHCFILHGILSGEIGKAVILPILQMKLIFREIK